MKRKVIKLGPATLVVSLPSKWIKQFNVKPGNEVEIEESNNDLLIKTVKGFYICKESLDVSDFNLLHKRILMSKYLKGCDEIELKFDSLKKSRQLQKRADHMIGMEIIDQGKNRLLLKDIGSDTPENIHSILKRVMFLLHSISEESLKAIQAKETDLEYLADMELNINKFTEYCIRLLNKKGYQDRKETSVYYCIVFLLEQLGDDYKSLIHHLDKNKIKLSTPLIELYAKINSYHFNLEKIFFKFNLESCESLARERDRLMKEIEKSFNSKNGVVLMYYSNLVGTIIKIMNELMNIN